MVVYDWRMQKEASAGGSLVYAVLVHRVRGARTSADMWRAFLSRGLEILIVPAPAVHAVAGLAELRKVASVNHPDGARMGYNRKGYREGYRNVSLGALRELAPVERIVDAQVYGEKFTVRVLETAPEAI